MNKVISGSKELRIEQNESDVITSWDEGLKKDIEHDRQLMSEREELDRKTLKNMSVVAAALDADVVIEEATFPQLLYMGQMLVIGEYYPKTPYGRVALDKFWDDDYDRDEVAFKRRVLNSIGIKYMFLDPTKSLADILPDLESQKVE